MKKFKQRNLRDYGFKCPNPECVDCHITEIALRVYLESLKLVEANEYNNGVSG